MPLWSAAPLHNMSIDADSGTWSTYRRQRDAQHLPVIMWALHTCPITHSHTAHLHFQPSFIYHFISPSLPLSFSVSRLLESSSDVLVLWDFELWCYYSNHLVKQASESCLSPAAARRCALLPTDPLTSFDFIIIHCAILVLLLIRGEAKNSMFLWWLFWLVRCGKPFVAHTEMCLLKRASWRRPSLRRAQTDKCIKLCRNSFHMSTHAYIHIPALQVTHTHLSTLLRLSYVGFWMLNQASLGQPASLERPCFWCGYVGASAVTSNQQ